ncbi:MAG TPA: prepilin-type N-terminal cleavage/methylation domain-containing protein [Patescibacteria group bacterium]|jgi:type IV pilus assembly protein PilA
MTKAFSSMTKRGQKGFTLIELLVVIAIIAILAALILAALNSAQKGARDSQRRSDVSQIKTAASQYQADNSGTYAATIGDMVPTYLGKTPAAPQQGAAAAKTFAYFGDSSGFCVSILAERDSKYIQATPQGQTNAGVACTSSTTALP